MSLPGGNEDNDLFVERGADEGGHEFFMSEWEPNAAERALLASGERINLLIYGAQHPPVAMSVGREAVGR